jgi:hypothetical protein
MEHQISEQAEMSYEAPAIQSREDVAATLADLFQRPRGS